MKCNYLYGRYMLACKAGPRSYVPSSFEIEEYCKTGRHRVCPLYFMHEGERTSDCITRRGYSSGQAV